MGIHPETIKVVVADPLHRAGKAEERRTLKASLSSATGGAGSGMFASTHSRTWEVPCRCTGCGPQCGAANPRGIVKWTGVRFSDFANMLGLVPGVHYCRLVASDKMYNDEAMATLMHPQVTLAWMMNDAPIPPKHGAPLRLIVPFRYGNRSI